MSPYKDRADGLGLRCRLLVETNLKVGHVVLQQSLSVADVLLSSHKHKGNHTLGKHTEVTSYASFTDRS